MSESTTGKRRKRTVRSFVRRTGRMTPGQGRALDELWPRYGIDYAPVGGRRATRMLDEKINLEGITDLILDCSALSVGVRLTAIRVTTMAEALSRATPLSANSRALSTPFSNSGHIEAHP